jgi:hypothetical protein
VGWKAWNKQKYKEPISDIATCSDESFVLLTLKHNYDRWMGKLMATLRAGTTETNATDSDDEEEKEEIFPANDLEGVVAPVGAMVTPWRHPTEEYDPPYNPPNE